MKRFQRRSYHRGTKGGSLHEPRLLSECHAPTAVRSLLCQLQFRPVRSFRSRDKYPHRNMSPHHSLPDTLPRPYTPKNESIDPVIVSDKARTCSYAGGRPAWRHAGQPAGSSVRSVAALSACLQARHQGCYSFPHHALQEALGGPAPLSP